MTDAPDNPAARYINDGAQDALNRMGRASRRGTGCHLTADMIEGLSRTFLAETWEEADPRLAARKAKP